MAGGIAVMLILAAQSAQASTDKEEKSNQAVTGLEKETIATVDNSFEPFSFNSSTENLLSVDEVQAGSGFKSQSTLHQKTDNFFLTSPFESSNLENLFKTRSQQWLAQTPAPPSSPNTPAPMVPQPQITIQESNNVNPDPNAAPNTDVTQPVTPDAPVLPRAVAPPVGDMAISNIDPSAELIDLGTDILVPRLVLRQAPAREVLAVLARYAGLNLVFTDGGQGAEGQTAGEPTVSLDLENESVQEVFNSVLLVSGLRANRRGRTIFVGSNLPQEARNLISRTLRLNQASVIGAGTVLATQGASFQRVVTPITEITDPVTQRVVRREEQPPQIQPITVAQQEGQGANAPTLLSGLTVTADDRLNAITLTGDPRQVEIATSMLTQLDARRRQVAINVKVIDVNLSNEEILGSSFSFGINDSFFIQDQGAATIRFGTSGPVRSIDINSGSGRVTNPPSISDPLLTIPGLFEYPRRFLAQLNAQITTGNAKILTDPTLVVQEGQEATVRLVQQVLTSVNTEVDPLSGVRTTTPVLEDSGLTLTVNIERIDDNGFVNLSVSPTVAAPGDSITFDSGNGTLNTLTPLNRRELSSGLLRLRDGQTLIVSGIIQDSDRTVVSKVPLLGDIPLIGALFRSTDNIKERAEVIILLTPQIIDDDPRSQFGYNYNPSPASTEMLNDQGFEVPFPTPEEDEEERDEEEDNPSPEQQQ
jgi:type IV pilus assembly protein PilQ